MPQIIKKPLRKTTAAADRPSLQERVARTQVELVDLEKLKPNPNNAKLHPSKQIALLAKNLEAWGYYNPLVVDEENRIIAGHARLAAARHAKLHRVPIIRLEGLTEPGKAALALADNRLPELGRRNNEVLAASLNELFKPQQALGFDPKIIGFGPVEVGKLLGQGDRVGLADDYILPTDITDAVTRAGNVWRCGNHKLICREATDPGAYQDLLGEEPIDVVALYQPDNADTVGIKADANDRREVDANSDVGSRRTIAESVLAATTTLMRRHAREGAPVFARVPLQDLATFWAHAEPALGKPKAVISWITHRAEPGLYYRSSHELISILTAGECKPEDFFKRRRKGRFRTNVWSYADDKNGPDNRRSTTPADAAMASRPALSVAVIVDILLDCCPAEGVVFDPFGGVGNTMIAAQRTGRRARLIEADPRYCDMAVRRWEKFAGKSATLVNSDASFKAVSEDRQQRRR